MKHKFVYYVESTKRGFMGISHKVKEKRVIYLDDKTYKKMKKVYEDRVFDGILLYDCIFQDD